MRARTYALSLIATAVALLCAVMATNLLLDPQGIYRGKTLDLSPSANNRYFRLKSYQAGADRYEALFFASSRGHIMPIDELSHYAGVKFASFSLYGGTIVDYLPVLKYVLRDKKAKGQSLRAVFLLLDADTFGERPITDRFLQHTWPPEITGDSWARFWWKNLSAIQLKAWTERLRSRGWLAQVNDTGTVRPLFAAGIARDRLFELLSPAAAHAQSPAPQPEASAQAQPLEQVSKRRYFAEHLALLQQFIAVCREQNIRIILAVSPFRREFTPIDETDLTQVVDKISRLAPLWDFSSTRSLSDQSELWSDRTHFRLPMARMMLERVFGIAAPGTQQIGVQRGS